MVCWILESIYVLFLNGGCQEEMIYPWRDLINDVMLHVPHRMHKMHKCIKKVYKYVLHGST